MPINLTAYPTYMEIKSYLISLCMKCLIKNYGVKDNEGRLAVGKMTSLLRVLAQKNMPEEFQLLSGASLEEVTLYVNTSIYEFHGLYCTCLHARLLLG